MSSCVVVQGQPNVNKTEGKARLAQLKSRLSHQLITTSFLVTTLLLNVSSNVAGALECDQALGESPAGYFWALSFCFAC